MPKFHHLSIAASVALLLSSAAVSAQVTEQSESRPEPTNIVPAEIVEQLRTPPPPPPAAGAAAPAAAPAGAPAAAPAAGSGSAAAPAPGTSPAATPGAPAGNQAATPAPAEQPAAAGAPAPAATAPTGTSEATAPATDDDLAAGEDGESAEIPEPEQSAILPSAEDHDRSAAPTMEIDCEADPEMCIERLEEPAAGPDLSEGTDDPAALDASNANPVESDPEAEEIISEGQELNETGPAN
jgi:hypothetical protein